MSEMQDVRKALDRIEGKLDEVLSADGLAGDVRELRAAEKRHQSRIKQLWAAFVTIGGALVGSHFWGHR